VIAISIQFSNCFQPTLHLALPPVPTNDFKIAKEYALIYMRRHFPAAVNVTYHLMRDDWVFESNMIQNQESTAFSLN
jgi:hypothetical protein